MSVYFERIRGIQAFLRYPALSKEIRTLILFETARCFCKDLYENSGKQYQACSVYGHGICFEIALVPCIRPSCSMPSELFHCQSLAVENVCARDSVSYSFE